MALPKTELCWGRPIASSALSCCIALVGRLSSSKPAQILIMCRAGFVGRRLDFMTRPACLLSTGELEKAGTPA